MQPIQTCKTFKYLRTVAKLKRFKKENGYHGELGFMCPGCNEEHYVRDKETEGNGPVWTFNGDFEHPTIRASVLTHCFMWNKATQKYDLEEKRCHSFITDGKIQFLSDCMHELAGQTVELPEIE